MLLDGGLDFLLIWNTDKVALHVDIRFHHDPVIRNRFLAAHAALVILNANPWTPFSIAIRPKSDTSGS